MSERLIPRFAGWYESKDGSIVVRRIARGWIVEKLDSGRVAEVSDPFATFAEARASVEEGS